jgi:hypothetical protein
MMLRLITKLLAVASILDVVSLRAEVSAEIDGTGMVVIKKRVEFPILVTLVDDGGRPIKGASIELQELGLNLSSDEEIVRGAKTRTNENGMVVLMHPAMVPRENPQSFTIRIHSVATIVAEGFRTSTIKIQNHFEGGIYTHMDSKAPHLKLVLMERSIERANTKDNAQKNKAR